MNQLVLVHQIFRKSVPLCAFEQPEDITNILYLAEKFANNLLESISEVPGKEGVDEGVDGRVAVAQPETKYSRFI
jgi:hypothetical protein